MSEERTVTTPNYPKRVRFFYANGRQDIFLCRSWETVQHLLTRYGPASEWHVTRFEELPLLPSDM